MDELVDHNGIKAEIVGADFALKYPSNLIDNLKSSKDQLLEELATQEEFDDE